MKKNIRIIATLAIVVMCAAILVACVPQSVEKAEQKMKDADYIVVGFKDSDKPEGVTCGFVATRVLKGEIVTAIWYSTSTEAKDAFNEYKEANDDKDTIVKRSGKCVYFGTEGAIQIFEG